MGGSPIRHEDMERYYEEREYVTKATNASQVFKETWMPDDFNPALIKLPREALDSTLSPHSRAIILAEDVTGSMGKYILSLIQNEFPRLIRLIYESVQYNPHVLFAGVGDVAAGDEAPLQVTQFETDLRMLDQLQRIYLERKGGWNSYESYILPWYFAAKHVRMDCFEKRREKGFLFTFGDEEPTPNLTSREIKEVFGENSSLQQKIITAEDCLELASEKFYCYHIILHGNSYDRNVVRLWRELMGSHVCDLGDHHYLPELVSTILKMYEGFSKTDALEKIQESKARSVVEDALKWHEEKVEGTSSNSENEDSGVSFDVF